LSKSHYRGLIFSQITFCDLLCSLPKRIESNMSSKTFAYEAPLQPGAPWPTYRRTIRNSGRSPLPATYQGDKPWFFQTGKGIFSTPIIDEQGIIYVGSADHNFYAINPDGSEKWCFRTGEMIDSAGALPADMPGTVLVPSGDGYLYRLNSVDGSLIWKFDARISPRMSYNNWFEANITLGRDGTIYAGNTNFNYYAIKPDGQLKWTYETGSNAWSASGIDADGSLYWGSCDTFFHAVSANGQPKWKRRTLGFISASPAIGLDGTVYAGSFDSYFYAMDPATGKPRWKFKANDHIYASAALLEDEHETKLIIFVSTDGIVYALNPQGELQWQFDTSAPIRSSPVIGNKPDGESGQIVYFGNGGGKLYALDVQTGKRRWSFDTTGAGDALPDRNDLNGSPALGERGVYIGGEHGQVWYVPYDYPLHHPEEPRGSVEPKEELPHESASLYFVTPGGRTQPEMPDELPASTIICLKLIVRKDGTTVPSRFYNSPFFNRADALKIELTPHVPFHWEVSGDGQYLYIIPDGFLEPGVDYSLSVNGLYFQGGLNIGNLTVGGKSAGSFTQTFVLVWNCLMQTNYLCI
jgi:outer membrane protein assembly factor BamB